MPDPPTVFFDLDGPLLDVRYRYHGVYASIAAELGAAPLDPDAYWAAKRARAPLMVFFSACEDQDELREFYLNRWLARIEAPDWLERDTVIAGAAECLARLQPTHRLVLVTLRSDPDALAVQLERTGLARCFTTVCSGWVASGRVAEGAGNSVNADDGHEGARLKARWIRDATALAGDVVVGDTEIDMRAAQIAGVRAIGVSFGIREPVDLFRWGAEAVIDHPLELVDLLGHGSTARASQRVVGARSG